MNLKQLLGAIGTNSGAVANQLSQYGDAQSIKNALDSGDTKQLGFIAKEAERIKQQNPQLFNMAQRIFSTFNGR